MGGKDYVPRHQHDGQKKEESWANEREGIVLEWDALGRGWVGLGFRDFSGGCRGLRWQPLEGGYW